MSSSCAWCKLFEIRRLIFHIGNPNYIGYQMKLKELGKEYTATEAYALKEESVPSVVEFISTMMC